MRIPILAALAVALALSAAFLWSTPAAHADGCHGGNTPNVIQVQHGIYECNGQISENFPFGHVFAPHEAGAIACAQRLADDGLTASAAWWAQNSSPQTGGELVSTFCQDLLYVGDGPNECSYWAGAGGNDQGFWPEANFEACEEWARVAFSESSVAVYIGDGAVDLPLTGPQRIHGAAEDNPAQDVILGVGCPDGCPKDQDLQLPEYVDDPHTFVDRGEGPESVGGTPPIVTAEEEAPLVLEIKPPSAGTGGLLDQEGRLMVLAVLLVASGIAGAGVALGVALGTRWR